MMTRSGARESKVVDLAEEREIRQFLLLASEEDLIELHDLYVHLRMREARRNVRAALECEPFITANCEFAE